MQQIPSTSGESPTEESSPPTSVATRRGRDTSAGAILSAVDRTIIAQLQLDGRTPFSALAGQLGISEATVQRRTQQLIDDGYFKIIGVVDVLAHGEGHSVLVGLQVDPPAINRVADAVARIPQMRFVASVTGTYDVIGELVVSDRELLVATLTGSVAQIPGIRTINTAWVMANFLTNFQWGPAVPGIQTTERRPLNGGRTANSTLRPADMDDLDRRIIALLEVQGRMSYTDLASQIGTTESTARRRTLRLLDSGYFRVVAVGNPFRLGFQEVIMLWIKTELARTGEVLEQLAQLPAVRYLSRVAAGSDVVAEALFADRQALLEFLDGPLARVSGIREIAISFELTIHKRGYFRFDS